MNKKNMSTINNMLNTILIKTLKNFFLGGLEHQNKTIINFKFNKISEILEERLE